MIFTPAQYYMIALYRKNVANPRREHGGFCLSVRRLLKFFEEPDADHAFIYMYANGRTEYLDTITAQTARDLWPLCIGEKKR